MNAPDTERGTARGVRGVLAASAATLVALASHLAGGGDLPGWLGVLVPLVLSLPVCIALVGRRLSLPRLSVSVAASQLLFHLLFQLGTPAGTLGSVANPHGAHGAHGDMAPLTTSGAPVPVELLHGGPQMWLWHGIAAAVTVVVLHRGELLLRRLRELGARAAAWLLRGRPVLDRPTSFVAPARTGVPAETFRPLHPGPQLSPLLRRGPPAPHAV